jgi:hypothetical protein
MWLVTSRRLEVSSPLVITTAACIDEDRGELAYALRLGGFSLENGSLFGIVVLLHSTRVLTRACCYFLCRSLFHRHKHHTFPRSR